MKSALKLSIISILTLSVQHLYAQCSNTCGSNLVPNPGFETSTAFCDGSGQLHQQLYTTQTPVDSWYGTDVYLSMSAPTGAASSPDYFNGCGASLNAANSSCKTGNAMVGFFTKTSAANSREYVQGQLTSPLVAGKTYCFAMVVVSRKGAAGNLLSSCDGVGAWFHNQGVIDIQAMNGGNQFLGPGSIINATPQVQNASGNMIGGTCVTVTGTFCATGGENRIVIGNFRTDANTQMSGSNPSNYMYIDELSLFEICSTPLNTTIAASPASVCPGSCSALTGTATGGSGAYTYLWSPGGATTNTISVCPSTTTTYTLVTSSSAGCATPLSNTTTVTVNVTPLSLSINTPAAICNGSSATLNATPSSTGGTFLWSPGGQTTASITVNPASTTTYSCTYTNAGCSANATSVVTVNPVPGIASTSTTICNGGSATLTANGGTTYLWNTGATTASITVSPTSTTTYTVTGTTNGCSNTATGVVTVNALPNIASTSTTICNGSSATLTASGGTTYSWSTGATTNTITVSPTTTTTYTVTGTTNGCSNTATGIVTVNDLPNVSVNSPSTCSGVATTLTGSGADTYVWSTGATSSSISVSLTTNTSYTVTGTDINGCSNTAISTITVTSMPNVTVNSPSACIGATITLTANGANTYTWSTGETTQSISVSPVANTSYTVTGSNGPTCTNTAIANATIHSLPNISATSSTICAGVNASLTATGGTSYSWNTGETSATITPSPAATTSYTVTGTDANNCSNTAVTTVTVNDLPPVSVNSPTICSGSNATLTATGAATYSWSTGENTAGITPSPSASTTYTVTGADANNCVSTAVASVTVNNCTSNSPCTNICGSNIINNGSFENSTSFCSTADIQLYTDQTPVAEWFGTEAHAGIVGSSPDYFSPCAGLTNNANNQCFNGNARVGVFTHTSFANGREYVQSQLSTPLDAGKTYCFSMVVKSKVGAAGNTLSNCDGMGAWIHNQGLIDINTMNGGQQFIGPGSIINAAPQVENAPGNLIGSACVTVTGTFCAQGGESWIVLGNFRNDANTQITGSNPSNYMYIDDVNLFEICSTPLASPVSATQASICPGECSTLSTISSGASGSYTYLWMPGGQTSSSISVCPSSSTTYTLTTTSQSACGTAVTVSETVSITVNNCFSGVTVNTAGICAGSCTSLIATPIGATTGISYSWQPGNLTGASINICPSSTTIYTVTASDGNGLSFTDTAIVNVSQLPNAYAGANDTICAGSSTMLTGSGTGSFYWSTTQTSQSITVSPNVNTDYILTVSNGGCVETDTVSVVISQPPVIQVQPNNISCFGLNDGSASATISGGTQPLYFTWNPGAVNANTISNLSAGTYTFTVTDAANCVYSQSITITQPAPLQLQINGASVICAGKSTTLQSVVSGGNSSYNFNWHGAGPNTAAIQVAPIVNTTYSLTVTDPVGCQGIASHFISVENPPRALFSGSDTLCIPFISTFTNLSTNASDYLWYFGDGANTDLQNPSHTYTQAGVYNVSLVAISGNGCRDSVTMQGAIHAVQTPGNTIRADNSSVSEFEPVINYSFNSSNSISCSVNFGDGTIINSCGSDSYLHTYKDTGSYCATITSTNAIGCTYTSTACVYVEPEFSFYVPNAFSPDGDGHNDTFTGYGANFTAFEMNIYNRWGELIYTSNDYNKPWDGRASGKSEVAQIDVYIYKIVVHDMKGSKKIFNGHVGLIR